MIFRLDHVIIAVHDLERAIEDYRALGFNVLIGGRHSTSTSRNALIVFADGAYFELIAWPEPDPSHRWFNVLQEHDEGLMDFALLPEDVPRAIAEAKSRGLALTGPFASGRVRPDGVELKWHTGRQATFDLPFLCGDVTARDLRVPTGEARRHPNGAVGIAKVSVAVLDVQASLSRYSALLGAPVGGDGVVRIGDTCVVLAEIPRTRGEGPCAVTIASASTRTPRILDSALSHHASLELVPA